MSVGDINVKLGLDTSAFSSGLATAKAQAMALGGTFDGLGKSLNNLGVGGGPLGGIGKALGELTTTSNLAVLAVGAIGVAAISVGVQLTKMAADYQSAMAKVAATTGMTTQGLKDMQGMMYQNAAQGSRLSQTTQAGIAAGLGGAGLIGPSTSTKDQLALLKLVEQSMIALESPTDDVIQLFATLQTRFGAGTEEMSKSSSAIAQMADSTAASNSEIIQATMTMGRLAGTVSMSIPEMIALASATKSSGIQAAEVGTQWSSLTRALSSQTEGAAAAFTKLGMSQEDWFAVLQESKNTGSNAPILKFLKELDKNVQKSDDSARISMQLYGSYGATLGGSLNQVITKYDELNSAAKSSYDSNVRITEEYNRQTDTLNSMIDALGAKFNAMGVMMGTSLLKPIQDATYQFDQFLGKVMQGDFASAWEGLYGAILNYDWVGAGVTIATAVASGLMNLARFGVAAVSELGMSLLKHDWIGSGRSIAGQIVDGFNWVKSGISKALDDAVAYSNSGKARETGSSLGEWIVGGVQSAVSTGMDIVGWIGKNLNASSISKLLTDAFSSASTLVSVGIKVGKDFLGGLSKSITEGASGPWKALTTSASNLVGEFTELGARIANALTAGIASTINSALNPLISAFNSIMSQVNNVSSKFGIEAPQIQPIALSGTSYGSGSTDVWGQAKDMASGKWIDTSAMTGKISGKEALPYTNTGDYLGFITAQAQAGASLSEAQSAAKGKFGNQTFSSSSIQGAYNKGKYGGMSGNMLTPRPEGETSATTSGTAAGVETPTTEASKASAAGAMGEAWSKGVVPVEVTNWPAGGIGGAAAAGAAGGAVGTNQYGQTVDAQGRPIGKFDASKINNTGPGIGMVKTDGGNTNANYADRLNIDTCEIDSFGMTPGLGKELAASGAWKPNAGAASQKLAAEIGYQGNYADPSQYGASMGSMNQSAKIQTNTATKTSGITIGAATKASSITVGSANSAGNTFEAIASRSAQKNAQTMDAASLNAKISMEDGAYSCFNAIDGGAHTFSQEMALVTAEQKAASVVARDNIQAGGQHVKDNSLSSSLDFKNTITTAGTEFKTNVAGATTSLGAMLGGIPSMMGYTSGGGYSGGGSGGAITATGGMNQSVGGQGSNWGGTSISGGGGHVGSGASNSGWGAAASASASKGGGGSMGGVKWFAEGGIVNRPSIVGVGEAGTEAIVPLGKLPEIMSKAMGGIAGAGAHTHAINVDGKKIADAVGSAMISRTRQGSGLKVR